MRFSSFFILTLFLGCKSQTQESKTIPIITVQEKLSFQDIVKRSYDIPELKNYTDTSKYIALFMISKRYNNLITIELTEIANGINLCVKQPAVITDFSTYDSLKSLPFNQLCYWFADSEARRIKDGFRPYEINKSIEDISCSGCLDPEIWTIEIYNHGRYSSITKDAYGEYEPFIDSLFTLVHLNKKNRYHIQF
jgi:hypothetical protein